MDKIIFLDIDGVLNSEKSRGNLCPKLFNNLKYILDNTNAKIVISSSWRRGSIASTIQALTDNRSSLIGDNPFPFGDEVIGQTKRLYVMYNGSHHNKSIPRGCEIQDYLDDHDIQSYVILDDDTDFLLSQKDNFVNIDSTVGLTMDDAIKAVEILNNI